MQSFLSKALRPGLLKAEITAVDSQWGPPPCQHPWRDKAMVTWGKLCCITTSPCFRGAQSVAQTLKVPQLLIFCHLPCLLQRPRRWTGLRAVLPDGSFSSQPSSKVTRSMVSQGIHLCPAPPWPPKSHPSFYNTGIAKLHCCIAWWQGGKVGSPQLQGPGEAPGQIPGLGGPATGSAPGHRSSSRFRRDFRFCRCLLLRKHSCCAEGWDSG